MVAIAFRHPIGIIQLHDSDSDIRSASKCGHSSVKFISKNFAVDVALFRKGRHCSYRQCQQRVVHALSSEAQTTYASSSNSNVESSLIMIRHGESMWNEKNLFTGCVDVPLTKRGVDEAIEAGKRISSIPVDIIYTSSLLRARMTAMLIMGQHRCKKVPIIMHNENRHAEAWSQMYSGDTEKQSIPVITASQLNERMYGELQGHNKLVTAERLGMERVLEWRRSYSSRPPNGESLEMCSHRAVAYFKDHIQPQLQSGRHVMVAAHANSLRSIIMYLESLTSQEIASLELPTGLPLLYTFKEGNFLRRGSPIGPTQDGVYAYTEDLALYKQKLDENVF